MSLRVLRKLPVSQSKAEPASCVAQGHGQRLPSHQISAACCLGVGIGCRWLYLTGTPSSISPPTHTHSHTQPPRLPIMANSTWPSVAPPVTVLRLSPTLFIISSVLASAWLANSLTLDEIDDDPRARLLTRHGPQTTRCAMHHYHSLQGLVPPS